MTLTKAKVNQDTSSARMAIEKTESLVILKHSSGASAKILKYGATVIEWTLDNGTQNLFLSELVSSLTPLTEVLQN